MVLASIFAFHAVITTASSTPQDSVDLFVRNKEEAEAYDKPDYMKRLGDFLIAKGVGDLEIDKYDPKGRAALIWRNLLKANGVSVRWDPKSTFFKYQLAGHGNEYTWETDEVDNIEYVYPLTKCTVLMSKDIYLRPISFKYILRIGSRQNVLNSIMYSSSERTEVNQAAIFLNCKAREADAIAVLFAKYVKLCGGNPKVDYLENED